MTHPWMADPDATGREAAHDDDKFREECGVFGIYGHDAAAAMTA